VKRTLITLGALAALGLCVYVGNLWAEGTDAAAARTTPTRTRIALFNLAYVVKYYKKNEDFQKEMQKELQKFQDKHNKLNKQFTKLSEEVRDPKTTAERKDQLGKQLTALKRDIEDNQNEAKKIVGKKGGDHLVALYREIYSAAHRYALAHNFELVMHYNDAVEKKDYNGPANIDRKMRTGACMPIYMAGGMEISQQLVIALNASYKRQ
jgi:Skp family chaperone for outer membrane proteins